MASRGAAQARGTIPAAGGSGSSAGSSSQRPSSPPCRSWRRPTSPRARTRRSPRSCDRLLHDFAGRPTPVYLAANLTAHAGGAKIFLKREDLLHGGAHKINNTIGQALLAKRMGKRRIIAETGAGQHGVATAMACAALGLKAEVYMGTEDIERQKLNVFRMKLLGAQVHPVDSGSRTLKDAINEALRDWVTNVEDDLLPPRLGGRAPPVSRHGQGLPERDRPRGQGGFQEERAASPTR